jgi:uncharacterized protein (DUF433 family)
VDGDHDIVYIENRRVVTEVADMKEQVVSCSPDVMSGAEVFCGTRVPVQTLLDYLTAGDSIEDFLEGFPSVTRAQVVAFLEEQSRRRKRRLGALAGTAVIPADFDEPLPDNVIDTFEDE